MINTSRLQLIFFIILTAGVSVLTFFIFKPYLAPIFLAGVIAIASSPLYKKILKIFWGQKFIASFFAVFIILVIVLAPTVLIAMALFKEATGFYDNVSYWQAGGEDFLNMITKFAEEKIRAFSPDFSLNLVGYLSSFADWMVGHIDTFFSSLFKILIGLLLMIISLFYFLKDGDKIIKKLILLSPLSDLYDEQIIKRVGMAINSIVRGSLTIALVKGFLTASGFAIFGVPNPILWGVVSALASFVPIVGSGVVIAPAVLYLAVATSYPVAIGLAIWGVALIGLADNFLSPVLMKKGMMIHPFVILLSILGGVGFFGPIGFIAGPVVLSLLFALFDIYPLVTKKIIDEKNETAR